MLPRPLRLRQAAEFERVRAVGRAWRHPLVMLSAAPNGLPHNRYGFVTSKRIGNAVQRNRARRLLREATRHLHNGRLKTGWDVVWIARDDLARQPYSKVAQVLEELCRRADLLAKPSEE